MVYSMNECSIIHETSCQVSLSTAATVSTTGTTSITASTAYESVPYPLPTASESTTPGQGTPSATTFGQATTRASQTSEDHPSSTSEGGIPTASETAPPSSANAAGALIGNVAHAAAMGAAVAGIAVFCFI